MKSIYLITCVGLLTAACNEAAKKPAPVANAPIQKSVAMLTNLKNYSDTLTTEFDSIDAERKTALQRLSGYIQLQKDSGKAVELIFICTHNSRRSHFGQVWAATAAAYYAVPQVNTYSGGTEATAFNERAVAALQRAGFDVENPGGANPRYRVHIAPGDAGLVCFSKRYDDAANPQRHFGAVMTCSDADEACPFIPGADFRLSLPYRDPKEADGTPQETDRYDERCRQIAREMMYAFSLIH